MARKKISQPQYGEPTAMVSVRMPAGLHQEIQVRAKRERVTKSRKIVQMLNQAIGTLPASAPAAAEDDGSVFE